MQPATRSGFILKRPRDVPEHCKSFPSVCHHIDSTDFSDFSATPPPGVVALPTQQPSGLLRGQGSHVASRTAAATRGERKCAVAAMRWAFFSGGGRFSPTFRLAGQVDLSIAGRRALATCGAAGAIVLPACDRPVRRASVAMRDGQMPRMGREWGVVRWCRRRPRCTTPWLRYVCRLFSLFGWV